MIWRRTCCIDKKQSVIWRSYRYFWPYWISQWVLKFKALKIPQSPCIALGSGEHPSGKFLPFAQQVIPWWNLLLMPSELSLGTPGKKQFTPSLNHSQDSGSLKWVSPTPEPSPLQTKPACLPLPLLWMAFAPVPDHASGPFSAGLSPFCPYSSCTGLGLKLDPAYFISRPIDMKRKRKEEKNSHFLSFWSCSQVFVWSLFQET